MPNCTKITQSNTTIVVDKNGEIESQSQSYVIRYPQEPPFIKLYLHDICYFRDMPRSYSNVLYELFKHMTYAGDPKGDVYSDEGCGMIVFLNSELKRNIMKNIGLTSIQSLNNIISSLTKGQLLLKIGRGTYRLNPHFFGKGDWKNIAQLQTTITYDINGRTFQQTITAIHRDPIIKDPLHPGEYTTLEAHQNESV